MLELLKIKKDINWLVDQIKCLIRKSDLDSPLSAIEWSTNHSVALGNPYILDCFVWFEGHVYKSLINDNQYPPTNSNYWADLGTGHLLVEEPSASGVTNLSPTQTTTNFTISSDTGTDATIPLGNGTSAGATLNDYTTAEKNKLAGIATGAEVNVKADWNATSGDAQILNKPVIPSTNGLATTSYVDTQDALKVDKVVGGTSSQFLKANGSTDSTAYYPYPIGTISQYLRGNGTLATFPTLTSGTVTSVGLSMPSAFQVTNSPVTSSDTLTVTGAGLASQYIRGDGQLASFPEIAGGGGGQVYYCNGGTSQGTIDANNFYQLSTGANLGTSANFTSGTVNDVAFANFITDIGKPTQEVVPAGVWLFQCYLSASASNVLQVYATVEVYNGSTFYVLATSLVEVITNGTTVDLYTFTCAVPEYAPLTTSDRIAIRFYPKNLSSGNTITLYTQNSNLSSIQSTFTTGLASLNGLTSASQLFATGALGNDFNINSTDITHTFNIPNASSATNRRGLLTASDWTTFNDKLTPNTAITGATKTKITYDSKGLVTVGADATTADIADSTNRRYVTDAKSVVLNNTTNNNSGDNAVNSLYSGLATSKQNTLSGTGFVKSTAGVISYDTSTYLTSAVTSFSGGTTGLTPSTATSGIITLAGTLAIANGGTGATTATGARTNLGATTIGSNIFTVTNPGAITFLRANANNTVSLLSAADFRTAIGVGTGGTITLNPIGSAPNVNGATITGSVLNLQPASLNFGGVVTIDPQTFAGIKSFTEDLVVNGLTVGKGSTVPNSAVNNTAIGIDALKVNTANNNTAIGKSALANNVGGFQNTAIGVNALLNNVGESSSVDPTIPFVGIYNTAVGFESLKFNTGNNNTALGIGTLTANTIGFQNTAIGSEALKTNNSGEENTAVGKDALRQNTDANWNTAVGSSALQGNVAGYQNTAVGRYASYSNFGGTYNTSIGVDSLKANINSSLNTGLGYKAGYTVTGARNTFLGSQDDNTISPQVTTVSNSIAIGYNSFTTKNNQAVLGNDQITETVLNGVIKQSNTVFTVSNVGNVTALGFFNSSDARLKDIIEQDGDTIKFTWKDKRDDKVHIGYVAQEIQEKYPDQVSEGENKMLSVNYIEVLVAKIQELENRIKQLEK
jgi:hypothetical protein